MRTRTVIMTILLAASAAALRGNANVLVDAESFAEKGGWVVDQQFTTVMGSPYLLAHGLGRPVADASTTVEIPKSGSYRVWVRTKNWVPGDWEAPGRFHLLVNGNALDPEFGTQPGWAWQDGGRIDIKAGSVTLALHDLTGFDGRCDAIFLTTDPAFIPPNDPIPMNTWRNTLKGLPDIPPLAGEYDAVIVGGGITGCAAALVAGERGLNVALIHDRPLLGGNASSEVRVHTIGIVGQAGAVLNKINTQHWPNGSPESIPDQQKRQKNMESAEGVNLFLKWRAYDVVMQGEKIVAVLAQHIESGETAMFRAPVFIDSTGDGWIGFWSGADYRYGRESYEEFGESWEKNGDLWSPEKPDNRVMGSSLLWYSNPGKKPEPFPRVPWAADVANGHAAVKGEWYWEYSADHLNQIEDSETIRDHLLRAIYGSFANANTQAKYASYRLDFVGYVLGKRESRRLMGDYVYTLKDITEGRDYPDAVAEETRDVDLHYQRHEKSAGFGQDFLSTALFMKVPRYRIPFRCLYSRNIENLMMAGRCFSCSHVALGGPRVMNTCGQMGVAVGAAAYLCKKHETTPRGVYRDHVEELRELVAISPAPAPEPSEPAVPRIMQAQDALMRTSDRYELTADLPGPLRTCTRVVIRRGSVQSPGRGFKVSVNQPVVAYLAVHERGETALPTNWRKTDLRLDWKLGKDTVYQSEFPACEIVVPPHTGKSGDNCGLPHMLLLAPKNPDGGKALLVTPVPGDVGK